MSPRIPCTVLATCGTLLACCSANAEITVFSNDFAGWQAAAGQFTTVDFVEDSPPGYVYFDHYASLGVLLHYQFPFDPTVPFWFRYDSTSSPYGAWLHDNGGILSTSLAPPLGFRFTAPIHAFAARLPSNELGSTSISLYREGQYLGVASAFGSQGAHRGLYSDESFDEIRFGANWRLDDIYFSTIPAPGALALLALAAPLAGMRRRR